MRMILASWVMRPSILRDTPYVPKGEGRRAYSRAWRTGWLSRGLFLLLAGMVGLLSAALALGQSLQGQPPLTVVSWGGAFTKSQMLAIVRPYRQSTGRWVNVEDYNGGLDDISKQVLSQNVTWDVVSLELADAIRGCAAGLLEPLDPGMLPAAPDGTPPREDFYDVAVQDCAIGYNVWATVIAYDPAKYPTSAPSKLADFFDVGAFPGRRGLRRVPEINLEWALLADGVAADQIYPTLETAQGLDRALDVLDGIKSEIVWWNRGSEPPNLLLSGRVAMSSAWNGRIFEAVRDRGANLEIIWDRQMWNMDAWGIPKGTERLGEARAFIKFALDPKRLAEQASYVAYGPARRSSAAMVREDVKPFLPTSETRAASALRIDYEWWAINKPVVDTAFQAWLEEGKPVVFDFESLDGN